MSKPNLLWIKPDPLHPLNTGGKIRTYNMLRELKKSYEITFLSLKENNSPINNEEVNLYSHKQIWIDWFDSKNNKIIFILALLKNLLFSSLPFVISRYTTRNIENIINQTIFQNHYDMVICDFPSLSKNLISSPKKPGLPYIIFQHNVESKIWQRLAINAGNPFSRFYFTNQWQRYLRYEKKACQWFDGVIAVSKDDAEIFTKEFKLNNVLGDVPTGVDVDYFTENLRQPEPYSLVFLGSMDWMPNVDGIIDFIENTYPAIKSNIPEVSLTIVGRNPKEKIIALAKNDASITVTGTVDDIRPFLAKSAISIVPLRIGGGTRIKIFETMAAQLPVVSTTIGAEGLPVENSKHICIADSSKDFADQVIALFNAPEKADYIANQGFSLVTEQFSWSTVTKDFTQMLEQVSTNNKQDLLTSN